MSLFSLFRTMLLLLGLAASGASSTAAFPKEGNYDYTACWSGAVTNTVGISKTSYGINYEFSGTTMSNPAGGAFDRLAFRCTGIAIYAEGKVSGGNVCETADNDGDKMLTHFTLDASRGEGGGTNVALGAPASTKASCAAALPNRWASSPPSSRGPSRAAIGRREPTS